MDREKSVHGERAEGAWRKRVRERKRGERERERERGR
jgi:hypothetical protein